MAEGSSVATTRAGLGRWGLLVVLALAAVPAACGSASPPSSTQAVSLPPLFLPDGFDPTPEQCLIGGLDAPIGSMLLFHDDGRRSKALRRSGSAMIRVAVWSVNGVAPATGSARSVTDMLSKAAPGSTYGTKIQNRPATGYELPAADLGGRPWPALVWDDGSLVIWVLGAGITSLEMVEVAESIRTAAPASSPVLPATVCIPSPEEVVAS